MPSRVLIAEDDEVQGAVLLAAITSRGHEAEIVTNGLEAVRRLRTGRFDLALLDYGLPEVDGLAAARLMQELVEDCSRPRLVAITAAAERLTHEEYSSGSCSFDAVVSKGAGLPALLAVVDDHLGHVARLNAATLLAAGREQARQAALQSRRRLLAPLAGVPGLAMAAVFAAAFYLAAVSFLSMQSAAQSAQQAVALSADAAALVAAVQDAQTSQRTYLATGLDAHRQLFEGDAQRVDRLLAGVSSLSVPGQAAADVPAATAVIEPVLRTLGREAQGRSAAPAATPLTSASIEAGKDAVGLLRSWADNLLASSQTVVVSALEVVRNNVLAVLVVLAGGIAYGIWLAIWAARREWRLSAPILLRQSTCRGMDIPGIALPPTPSVGDAALNYIAAD